MLGRKGKRAAGKDNFVDRQAKGAAAPLHTEGVLEEGRAAGLLIGEGGSRKNRGEEKSPKTLEPSLNWIREAVKEKEVEAVEEKGVEAAEEEEVGVAEENRAGVVQR